MCVAAVTTKTQLQYEHSTERRPSSNESLDLADKGFDDPYAGPPRYHPRIYRCSRRLFARAGNPWVLMQPAELLIICGSGASASFWSRTLLRLSAKWRAASCWGLPSALRIIPNPSSGIFGCCTRSSFTPNGSGGIMQIEADVEDPPNSPIFSNHPDFLRDRETRDFVCDSLRMLVIGVTSAA